jgi:putative oxidoreductase
LQRLFSTFANGWPGLGLLIQRLVLGIVLLYHGADLLKGVSAVGPIVPELTGSVLGLFILAGLWTPAVGSLVVVVQMWITLTGAGDESVSIILAVLGGTLAMIGPGAWSIDARLFGRKHIAG